MNLEKLFATQKKLDEHILDEHPTKEGENRLTKKILALQVELGELANELPEVFKFWSKKKNNYKRALEEYVDCLHFILSIGLEKKKFIDFEMELKATFDDLIVYKDETITKQFNNLFLEVGLLYDATHDSAYAFKNEFESYSNVFSCFIGLGELLGFTEDEIEQAYFAKNKVNHQRQEDGY